MTSYYTNRKTQSIYIGFTTEADKRNYEKVLKVSRAMCKANAFNKTHQKTIELGYLKNFNEIYDISEKIGAGGFATVYLGTNKKTGEKHAIKTIKKKFDGEYLENKALARLRNEVDIYNTLGPSLNVAYMYGAYEDDEYVRLALELCTGGPLWKRVKRGRYTEQYCAKIVRDIFRAIAQCHAKNIVMRDVKPENFLFLNKSEDSPLKAIDFGLAKYCAIDEKLSSRAGTPIYIAPEVLLREYGQKADVWSAAIIAYQMLTGRLPFVGDHGLMKKWKIHSNKDVFRAVLYAELDFKHRNWQLISNTGKDFLKFILQRNPDDRPCAIEALSHPWLETDEGEEENVLNSSIVQRLQMFGTFNKLKKVALRKIAEFVNTDSSAFADLKIAFEKLDPAQSGKVKYSVLEDMLLTDDYNISSGEIKQLLSQMEIDEEGYIDYYNWFAALIDWNEIQQDKDWNYWMKKAFKMLDLDQNGLLSKDEITNAICGELCEVPDTVPNVLRECDKDGDGLINFQEFVDIIKTELSDNVNLFDSRQNSK